MGTNIVRCGSFERFSRRLCRLSVSGRRTNALCASSTHRSRAPRGRDVSIELPTAHCVARRAQD